MEPLGALWAPKFSFRKWVCAAVSFVYICAHVYAYVCTQTFFLVRMRTCTQNSLHTRKYATELTRKKKLTAPWPGCKKVWYCGPSCQKKHASRHKNYCKLWADGVTERTWVVVYSTAVGGTSVPVPLQLTQDTSVTGRLCAEGMPPGLVSQDQIPLTHTIASTRACMHALSCWRAPSFRAWGHEAQKGSSCSSCFSAPG